MSESWGCIFLAIISRAKSGAHHTPLAHRTRHATSYRYVRDNVTNRITALLAGGCARACDRPFRRQISIPVVAVTPSRLLQLRQRCKAIRRVAVGFWSSAPEACDDVTTSSTSDHTHGGRFASTPHLIPSSCLSFFQTANKYVYVSVLAQTTIFVGWHFAFKNFFALKSDVIIS